MTISKHRQQIKAPQHSNAPPTIHFHMHHQLLGNSLQMLNATFTEYSHILDIQHIYWANPTLIKAFIAIFFIHGHLCVHPFFGARPGAAGVKAVGRILTQRAAEAERRGGQSPILRRTDGR